MKDKSEKLWTSTGFETMTSAIQEQCSYQMSHKTTSVGGRSIVAVPSLPLKVKQQVLWWILYRGYKQWRTVINAILIITKEKHEKSGLTSFLISLPNILFDIRTN